MTAALSAAACSVAGPHDDDDTESTSQGKTVTPRGAAYGLQVDLPPGIQPKWEDYAMNVDARFLPKGAPRDVQASWLSLTFGKVSWVAASEGCLSVRTRAGTTEDCNVVMAANTTTTVKLASLSSMFDGEILGNPDVRVEATGAGRSGAISFASYGERVVIAGDHAVKLGGTTYPVQVPAGAQAWSPKLVPTGAMNVVVTPPADPAVFPDHTQSGTAVTLSSGSGSTYIAPGRAKLYVLPATSGSSTTTLGCFGDVVESRPTGGTWTIALHRLDVDDVQTAGGAKVPGTFVLYRKQANGQWKQLTERWSQYGEAAKSPTKVGLDLPAGDYKIVTSYTVAGAAQAPIEDLVTLP